MTPLARIDVITLLPELVNAIRGKGITGRALSDGIVDLVTWNPRDFTADRHRTVDDRPYGGGPGMLMKIEPLQAAIGAARAAQGAQGGSSRTLHLTPQGKKLDQDAIEAMLQTANLILIAGRYEGVDERLVEAVVDEEWSIGDYVLSGGELPAMVLIDALVRRLPGVLGHASSGCQDSFSDGLLDCPHYTRPEIVAGARVPSVLLSGDHEAIRRWRLKQSLGRTWLRRPDLLARRRLDGEQQALLDEFVAEQNGECTA